MGVVVKDEWNQQWLGRGGLVVSLPTDQITTGISSSVSIRSKEVNSPGSIWGEKKCDNSNGHATFAFKCENFLPFNSIKWRRAAAWPSATMRMRGHPKGHLHDVVGAIT